MLQDSHGRTMTYFRLAVTDRCNLRCTYCILKEGLDWLPHIELMTYEEMIRICSLFVKMDISQIRITGGEPFMRKNLISFLKDLTRINGLQKLTLTTNGTLVDSCDPEFKEIGINSVNLSLDTLDNERLERIANRKGLRKVMKTLDNLLRHDIKVKINTVVMENRNIDDIIPLVQLAKKEPVSVRFIEEMPFNGGSHTVSLNWDYKKIYTYIQRHFPSIKKIPDKPHSISANYRFPGHKGSVGIIAAYSRLFCGSCNRVRITRTGALRTCLYSRGNLNIKDAVRDRKNNEELKDLIIKAIQKKTADGWEAQKELTAQHRENESMSTIGR